MVKRNELTRFSSLSFYKAHFMDPETWEPFIRQVCRELGRDCLSITPGLPGSFPTFIVKLDAAGSSPSPNPSVVVKFFGPLFDGNKSFRVERLIGQWLAKHSLSIPSPSILAQGRLNTHWQFLVFEYVTGTSLGEARRDVTQQGLASIAHRMGEYLHLLHELTALEAGAFPATLRPSNRKFARFLGRRKTNCLADHLGWMDLPRHLLAQLDDFVIHPDQLVNDTASSHLVHADLTADHLLGTFEDGSWQPRAIIDWGDAQVGNILYELVPLHLDLFRGDRRLLAEFFTSYPLPIFYERDFPRKAFSMALMHRFPLPKWVGEQHAEAISLQELAEQLYAAP